MRLEVIDSQKGAGVVRGMVLGGSQKCGKTKIHIKLLCEEGAGREAHPEQPPKAWHELVCDLFLGKHEVWGLSKPVGRAKQSWGKEADARASTKRNAWR